MFTSELKEGTKINVLYKNIENMEPTTRSLKSSKYNQKHN